MGITEDDLFGEHQIRFLARKDQIDAAKAQQQQAISSVQQFIASHPDINEVVGSVNPATGQIIAPSAKVLALVAKKSYLAGATLQMLYDSVVESDKLTEFEKVAATNTEHQTRVDDATLPMGASAAGGSGGSGGIQQQWISREEQNEIRRKAETGEL